MTSYGFTVKVMVSVVVFCPSLELLLVIHPCADLTTSSLFPVLSVQKQKWSKMHLTKRTQKFHKIPETISSYLLQIARVHWFGPGYVSLRRPLQWLPENPLEANPRRHWSLSKFWTTLPLHSESFTKWHHAAWNTRNQKSLKMTSRIAMWFQQILTSTILHSSCS